MHAGVLGCKETEAAKPDSHSILDYMPGEQPFEEFKLSRGRAYERLPCHSFIVLLLPLSEALVQHDVQPACHARASE